MRSLHFAMKWRPLLAAFAWVTLSGLSACSFREDPNAEKKADPAPVREAVNKHTISKRDFRVEFLPQERPNDYLIRLHWPVGKDVALNITRVRPLDSAGRAVGSPETEVLNAQLGSSIIGHCRSSRSFILSVTVVSPLTGLDQTHEITGHCPQDAIVARQEELSDVYSTIHYHPQAPMGRLFLLNGARLTSTEDATLEVSQLIVEGSASLELKPDQSVTSRPLENWRAPQLRLKAGVARGGHLKLILEGRNGDDGQQPEARAANPALHGAAGQAAQVETECRPRRGGRMSPDTVGETCVSICRQPPTPGLPGQPGQRRGENGRPGLPGIGTSEVRLEIQELQGLQLSVELKPGRGGQGSAGGLGEPGGQGGAAGANPDNHCAAASAGPNAPPAPAGDRGVDGPHGACGRLQLPRSLQASTSLKDLQLECSRDPRLIEWQ